MTAHISWTVVRRFAAFLLVALGLFSPGLMATSAGVSGYTARDNAGGCGVCHATPVTNPITAVTITGAASLDNGVVSTYTVTINSNVSSVNAGIDVAAANGTLSAAAGGSTNVLNGEIIHAPKKLISGGVTTFSFNYTLPATSAAGSTHILYPTSAIGPSTGGSWRHGTNFTVTTKPPATSTVTPSNTTSTTVDLDWTGGGPEYKVVYKTGAVAPATDTDGTQVTLGAVSSTTVTGLSASTQYSFKVFSKLSSQPIFSTTGATTTITTNAPPVAAPRYVNASTGSDTTNCTVSATPCKTITYAMGQATTGTPGDTITVAPGTYNVALGEIFPIVYKSGVTLLSSGRAEATIIDATGANARVMTMTSTNSSTFMIGFTLMGGLVQPPADGSLALGGAILINGGSPRIGQCIFLGNEARGYDGTGSTFVSGGEGYGGAIYVSGGSPLIVNSVFRNNIARGGAGKSNFGGPTPGSSGGSGQGGAIYIGGATSGYVNNNTFYNNQARGGPGGFSLGGLGGSGGNASYGALHANGVYVTNNIFDANSATSGAGGGGTPNGGAGFASYGAMQYNSVPTGDALNNLFRGNTVDGAPSTGDTIGTNSKCFFNPGCPSVIYHAEPTNLRIRLSSPAAGQGAFTAGLPGEDFDSVIRANPPSIGAFEAKGLATTVALSSSANPSTVGQSVTFTATVSSPLGGTPTGTVNFKDGGFAFFCCMTLVAGQAQITTSALASGTHSITVEYLGDATYAPSTSAPLSQVVNNPNPPRLGNISTRGQVLTGNDRMIAGFIIGGAVAKTVVVNVAGPSLNQFGLAGLPNPTLTLVRSSDQATLKINDDWQTQAIPADVAAIQASGFQPNNAAEPAIIATLPPGAYTAIVEGVGGGTGVGLVGVFEVDHPEIPLVNISTRGQVLTGNDRMIAGFIVNGTGSQKVVVNVAGPSLNQFGLAGLANPTLTLVRSSDQTVIATNDDWQTQTNPGDVALIQASGFQPNNAAEPAIIATLPPGAYTAIVQGVGGGTGVGLVGVFTAP
jgi:hypothetical protein